MPIGLPIVLPAVLRIVCGCCIADGAVGPFWFGLGGPGPGPDPFGLAWVSRVLGRTDLYDSYACIIYDANINSLHTHELFMMLI